MGRSSSSTFSGGEEGKAPHSMQDQAIKSLNVGIQPRCEIPQKLQLFF